MLKTDGRRVFDRCARCDAPMPHRLRDAAAVARALDEKPSDCPEELWASLAVPLLCDECEESDGDWDDGESDDGDPDPSDWFVDGQDRWPPAEDYGWTSWGADDAD